MTDIPAGPQLELPFPKTPIELAQSAATDRLRALLQVVGTKEPPSSIEALRAASLSGLLAADFLEIARLLR